MIENFLVDDTRNPRAYILLLYHLKYDPYVYQQEVDSFYKHNYYQAPDPAEIYSFANIRMKPIDWVNVPKENTIIIGDRLSVSENQQQEHNLTKTNEFKDSWGNVIFEVYEKN